LGNLGDYQAIVTLAKKMGGVKNLIKTIETGAVTKAAPKLIAIGIGIGGATAVGVMGVKGLLDQSLEKRSVRLRAAEKAKERLTAIVEGDPTSVPEDPKGPEVAAGAEPGQQDEP
jgi:tartrate dehydratase alpha subunit/fumarate hydratase class I-like protein